MDSRPKNKSINDFFQVFTTSVAKTLYNSLDKDVCTKIEYKISAISKFKNIENLKENRVIYKIAFASGNHQGTLVILIPEELIATISDILTGGTGENAYKESLSEIETNSILTILEKVFKNLEYDFRRQYEHDLAFSANPKLLLKEMPDYSIDTEDTSLDFLIGNTLSLTEDKKYDIDLLLTENTIEKLMDDLGLSQPPVTNKKIDLSLVNVDRLADVKINITAELGRTRVPIKYAFELVNGSLVELDTLVNSDIKVYANGVEFAHAQIVAVEDNFGLRITKIISPEERLESI